MTLVYGATTVTINTALFPAVVIPSHNDTIGVSEDGQAAGYSFGSTTYTVKLTIRCDATLRTALRSFYTTTVLGRTREFTLTPDTGVDLGAGAGTAITTARIWDADFQESFEAVDLFYVTLTIFHEGS